MHLYNYSDLKFRRKELRNKATAEELILWTAIKNSDLEYKIRVIRFKNTEVIDNIQQVMRVIESELKKTID